MTKEEKRGNSFIINLTDSEAQKLKTLSKRARRSNSELLYIIISDILAELMPDKVSTGVEIIDTARNLKIQ